MNCVIYDLDGTLYRKCGFGLRLALTNPRWLRLLLAERRARRILRGVEFLTPDAFYDELFGLTAQFAGCPYMQAKHWFLNIYMPSQVAILKKHYAPRKWVIDQLSQYRQQGMKTAVLSDYPYVEEKLEALGISEELFTMVTSSPELGGLKPCRETGMRLLKMLDAEPEETLMVGDRRVTDEAFAKACGMNFKKV